MKLHTKVKIADYKKLNLKGIEISEVTEKSSDDLVNIELKDTMTGTVIILRQINYGDFTLFSTKPPKFKSIWRITGKLEGFDITKDFDTEREANNNSTNSEIVDFKIEEVKVEVVE